MSNLFDSGYHESAALRAMGFGSVGEHVKVAKNCVIVGDLKNIRFGNDVRIDAFCTLIGTGPITIGSNVHIAGYAHLSGGDGIEMEDFSGVSQGVKLYSRTDDYSGEFLTNPTVPAQYLGVVAGKITLGKHVILGANTVVLPGVTLGEGCSVGAQSLVKENLAAWGVYAGCPVKRIRERSKDLLKLEAQLRG